jgi:hypothetical protein
MPQQLAGNVKRNTFIYGNASSVVAKVVHAKIYQLRACTNDLPRIVHRGADPASFDLARKHPGDCFTNRFPTFPQDLECGRREANGIAVTSLGPLYR